MANEGHSAAPGRRRAIRAPQDLVAGLALIAFAGFVIWAVSGLRQGTLLVTGPAMVPRWVAVAIGILGLVHVALAFLRDGAPLERWHLRGPVFVGGGMIAFALAINSLGFAVAAPLAMLIGSFAMPSMPRVELAVFTAGLTIFCLLLFRYLLDQPIPVLIVPGTPIRL